MRLPQALLLGLLSCTLAAPAAAQASDPAPELPWKQGGVYLGGFLTRYDSTVRLGADAAGLALEVNLEDAFGLDSSSQDLRFGAFWRFGESQRHEVTIDYLRSSRSASKTLQEDITIGDTTYPAGTGVSVDSTLSIIRASYSYSFVLDDRIDLAASFGLYTMPFSFEFAGVSNTENEDFTAPLPVFGLHADYAITPDLFLRQRIDLFYLEYGDFRGGLADIYLGLEWFPWEHVGIGLGFENFRLGIEAENDSYPGMSLNGNVKYQQTGLFGYLTYAF
ncbi:MAG: hypothetical protein JNK02_13335 [Planctomycetes bacterium]|nr:hypothetical protein [Planctomycetota bacterium]